MSKNRRSKRRSHAASLLLGALVAFSPGIAGAAVPGDTQARAAQGIDLSPVVDLICGLVRLPLICGEDSEPAPAGPAEPVGVNAAGSVQPGVQPTAQSIPAGAAVSSIEAFPPPAEAPTAPVTAAQQLPQPAPAAAPPEPSEKSAAVPRLQAEPGQPDRAGPLALALPEEVDFSGRQVAVAAGFSILGLIVIGFPAELFNKTLRENYASLRRLFPWIGANRAAPQLSGQIAALVVSSAAAGLIGSFQKVRDWSAGGVATVAVSLAIGFLVTNAIYELASAAALKELGAPARIFRAYPGALPFVALFVAISAVGGLQPAYVYGHIAGARIEDPARVQIRARALQTAAASVTLFLVAVACWALRAVASPPLSDILAGITIVGLNRLAFALIPATFLDGQAPFQYSRLLWASLYVPVVGTFLLLILLPATQRGGGGPVFASAALFVLFAAASLGIWLYFRRTRRPVAQAAT